MSITYRAQTLLARPGSRVLCECCGKRSGRFLPFNGRPFARCPHCEALERHRFLWPHLERLVSPESRVLHFAPEPVIARNLMRITERYVCCDINPAAYRDLPVQQAEITRLPFPDQTFDVIVVSHVLEHVPDDLQAMRELHRVLAPEGVAISQHPHEPDRPATFEDPTITDPAERKRAFGQYDHVRIYGRDLQTRWQEAGFDIRSIESPDPGETIFLGRRRLTN